MMATKSLALAPRHMTMSRERKQAWADEHYGIFARLARVLGYARCTVSLSYWGDKPNATIDKVLDRAIFANTPKRRKRAA